MTTKFGILTFISMLHTTAERIKQETSLLVSILVGFWKRCFLKTSVSNGIIYTKYTQNPYTIEPPFNIATQSAT